MPAELSEVTIEQLQEDMAAGARTAAGIAEGYLAAIEAVDGALCSVIETNPDALAIAEQMDGERAAGQVRGPLHGIPHFVEGQHQYGRPHADDGGLAGFAGFAAGG